MKDTYYSIKILCGVYLGQAIVQYVLQVRIVDGVQICQITEYVNF